jgi:hypothetical protein
LTFRIYYGIIIEEYRRFRRSTRLSLWEDGHRCVGAEEGSGLDRLLKGYLWTEFLIGVAVIVCGFFLGGSILFAVGACTVGFAAQCAARAVKFRLAAVIFGVFSLAVLAVGCVNSFGLAVTTSGYDEGSSPLTVLLVLAVAVTVQSFALLPAEDRPDLSSVTHGVSVLRVFAVLGLLGVVLNYLISYLLMGSLPSHMDALDSYYAGTGSLPVGIQDVHYVEGVVALAICLTAIRGVVRAFLGKDAVTETEKENLE